MLNGVLENVTIKKLTAQFHRSPSQINHLQESDAELVRLSSLSDTLLAVTTDSIVEEITAGLYDDPYLAGWMTVMVNMSDIAAVGAQPLGILVSETLDNTMPEEARDRLQRGISDACLRTGTFVLGGDTNFGDHLSLTGCALGTVEQGLFLSRLGCLPGDILYSSGTLGTGNAYALAKLTQAPGRGLSYLPVARLKEGRSLRTVATSCMDTSDGVIATLDQLMRLNAVGFELDHQWEGVLDPAAKGVAEASGMPTWLLLAGYHGEFELLFTVSSLNERTLLDGAERSGWKARRLGTVIEEPAIRIPLYGGSQTVDSAHIRNLSQHADSHIGSYIADLLAIDRAMTRF